MPATSRSGECLRRRSSRVRAGSPSKSMITKSLFDSSTWPRWKSPWWRIFGAGDRPRANASIACEHALAARQQFVDRRPASPPAARWRSASQPVERLVDFGLRPGPPSALVVRRDRLRCRRPDRRSGSPAPGATRRCACRAPGPARGSRRARTIAGFLRPAAEAGSSPGSGRDSRACSSSRRPGSGPPTGAPPARHGAFDAVACRSTPRCRAPAPHWRSRRPRSGSGRSRPRCCIAHPQLPVGLEEQLVADDDRGVAALGRRKAHRHLHLLLVAQRRDHRGEVARSGRNSIRPWVVGMRRHRRWRAPPRGRSGRRPSRRPAGRPEPAAAPWRAPKGQAAARRRRRRPPRPGSAARSSGRRRPAKSASKALPPSMDHSM